MGLDPEGIRKALDREQERSLAAVGVSASSYDLPAEAALASKPTWATSAKLAMERAYKLAAERSDTRIDPGHILLGVLDARLGTVPRALEAAGVDRLELARRAGARIDDAG